MRPENLLNPGFNMSRPAKLAAKLSLIMRAKLLLNLAKLENGKQRTRKGFSVYHPLNFSESV